MNLPEAIDRAQHMLATYDYCIYDKRAWVSVLKTLLPVAIATHEYHEFIHEQACGNPLPVNSAAIDPQRLEALLRQLCNAAQTR